jgi:hypothetical protein
MPTPAEILQNLARVSREQAALAVIWHILIVIAVFGIIFGWRPSKKLGATVLSVPLLSVSILAWLYQNPFNGSSFLLFALILFVLGLRRPSDKVDAPPAWAAVAGVVLALFGWVYPHFLTGGSWLRYLYRAPTGLIPCPTLSLVIGLALLANGFSSRAWSLCLGVVGVFYGLFGAFRLGVRIDLVLLFGAIALLVLAFTPRYSALSKAGREQSAA